MPGTSSSDANEPIEQASNDLSKAIGQLSLTADDFDETSTPPKNLSDMPFDVVELIIEKSDYKEQLLLRKTLKSLRELVDKQKPSLTRLEVACMSDCIFCWYNNHCVAYIPLNWKRAGLSSEYKDRRLDTIVSNANYEQVVFDDLALTLKNPKLQLETFSFSFEAFGYATNGMDYDDFWNWKFSSSYDKMRNILKTINPKLSAKECRIDVSNYSNAMSILPYLKPGVLEKIVVSREEYYETWSEYSKEIEQVARLEQWKKAKELQISSLIDDRFPTQHATHFKRFHFDGDYLFPDSVILIRDYILEHENAEFCLISDYDYFEDQKLTIESLDGIVGTPVSPNMSHYTVPESEYYLEIMIEDKLITIEKKKKKQ